MKKLLLLFSLLVIGFTTKAQNDQKDIPSTVLNGFSQKYPEIKMEEVKWNSKGEVYKATFSKGKSDYKVVMNNKGQWVSTEMDDVPASEIPGEVKAGIEKSEFGKWDITQVEAKEKPGEIIYKIEVENEMSDEEIYMNQEGNRVTKDRFTQKMKKKS